MAEVEAEGAPWSRGAGSLGPAGAPQRSPRCCPSPATGCRTPPAHTSRCPGQPATAYAHEPCSSHATEAWKPAYGKCMRITTAIRKSIERCFTCLTSISLGHQGYGDLCGKSRARAVALARQGTDDPTVQLYLLSSSNVHFHPLAGP